MAKHDRRPLAALLVFGIVAESLIILVSLADAASLAAAFGGGWWLIPAFLVLSFTFFSATLLEHRRKGRLIRAYYLASSYWLGLLLFLFFGAFSFFAAATVFYRLGMPVPLPLIGAICFGLFFLLHAYGTWHSGRTGTSHVRMRFPDLRDRWSGKTIVFASDLHLGSVRGRAFAAKIGKMIESLKPEAVIIGGDLYDGGACDEKGIIEPLRGAISSAPLGAYFVAGNHEYILADPQAALEAVRALGMRILDGEKVDLNGISLIGVDYKKARKKEDFRKILDSVGVPSDSPTILAKHEPSDLDIAREAGFSLGLFGHTHRGQLWPFSYITRRLYNGFDYGKGFLGDMTTYTSSGVGTWGPPLRIGTSSEIVVITID